jgi:exodeoxyribonuclease VIII
MMLDLETLGVDSNAVILSVGIVLFDPYSNYLSEGLMLYPDIDSQIDKGRVVDEGTLQWWESQANEAFEDAFRTNGRSSIEEVAYALRKLYTECDRVWSNGAAFDIPCIASLMFDFGYPPPWNFWELRDTRTVYEMAGLSLRSGTKKVSHVAVEDAIAQAKLVQEAYQQLNIKPKYAQEKTW